MLCIQYDSFEECESREFKSRQDQVLFAVAIAVVPDPETPRHAVFQEGVNPNRGTTADENTRRPMISILEFLPPDRWLGYGFSKRAIEEFWKQASLGRNREYSFYSSLISRAKIYLVSFSFPSHIASFRVPPHPGSQQPAS